MGTLLLCQDGMPQVRVGLGEWNTIGRAPECEIQLLDPQLSRQHSRIVQRGDGYWLSDLSSRNGTFLGGLRIGHPMRIPSGAEIRFGTVPALFDPERVMLLDSEERGTLGATMEDQPRRGSPSPARFLGSAPSVHRLLDRAARAAKSDARVLVTGESGTGKELIARMIHDRSARRAKPWVAINCGAVAASLRESALFGHEKGAFTGASQRRRGCFELADGGTLFLDEVGELAPATQVKLLRVIEEGAFRRVGGETPIRVDVRIVAATNRPLPELVSAGRFRKDLFYRLDVLPLHVPALRERQGDVPLLLRAFLERFARRFGKRTPQLAPAAWEVLERYPWPGNVRELQNLAERLVVLQEGAVVAAADLRLEPEPARTVGKGKLRDVLGAAERELVRDALAAAGGKKVLAARILGISRPTLDKKIADYDL